jgi:nitrite reductase (NO-forming)
MSTTEDAAIPGVDRRRFLALAGGGVAAAGLAGCADDGPHTASPAAAPDGGAGADATGAAVVETSMSPAFSDRSDSIIPDFVRIADLAPADPAEERMSYVPNVPARAQRSDQRIVEFGIDVIEGNCMIDPANEVSTRMWGFRIAGDTDTTCGSPGPVLRARVGDLARITVNNMTGNEQPHNIDFHAVTGQGGGAAALTVPPGESATINARLLYPGVFMYHCAFGDVPMHIAHGMYGMFIVDPEEPLPDVDHEWAITQSEWYLGEPGPNGTAEFDMERLRLEHPTYVTFNGRTDALTGDNSLQMAVGERARIYMVNEGLNLDSNFHPIGSHWDVVYPEAATHPVNRVIRGSQSTLVVAGGGTVTELVGQVPSTIILVDHALVRTFYKGCIGMVVVSGEDNGIFSTGDDGLAAAADAEPVPAPQDPNTILIPPGAWEPANAATAYSPSTLTVPVGTTVVWQNDDALLHTVTSGPSNGNTGTPDGLFDSGNIDPGMSWSHTFDETGTFAFHCTPHPWMMGSIEVTA